MKKKNRYIDVLRSQSFVKKETKYIYLNLLIYIILLYDQEEIYKIGGYS